MSQNQSRMDWKNRLLRLIQEDKIHTDSDIEDFCEEFNVDEAAAFRYLAELRTEYTECKGCQHIEFFGSGMYPCNMCRRGKRDLFVKADTVKSFVGSVRQVVVMLVSTYLKRNPDIKEVYIMADNITCCRCRIDDDDDMRMFGRQKIKCIEPPPEPDELVTLHI